MVAPFAAALLEVPNGTASSGGVSGARLVSRSGRLLEAKYPEPVIVHVDKVLTPRSPRVVDRCVAAAAAAASRLGMRICCLHLEQ